MQSDDNYNCTINIYGSKINDVIGRDKNENLEISISDFLNAGDDWKASVPIEISDKIEAQLGTVLEMNRDKSKDRASILTELSKLKSMIGGYSAKEIYDAINHWCSIA